MKKLFFVIMVLFASSQLFANVDTNGEVTPPILDGQLAHIEHLNLSILEVFPSQDPRQKAPYHARLFATVVYSSICQSPASFIVLKNAEPYSYSVIEAHLPQPKDQMSCQAINRVEMIVPIAEFFGAQPRIDQIKVNGIILK